MALSREKATANRPPRRKLADAIRMLALDALLKDLAAAGAVFMTMEDAAREAQALMFAPDADSTP